MVFLILMYRVRYYCPAKCEVEVVKCIKQLSVGEKSFDQYQDDGYTTAGLSSPSINLPISMGFVKEFSFQKVGWIINNSLFFLNAF